MSWMGRRAAGRWCVALLMAAAFAVLGQPQRPAEARGQNPPAAGQATPPARKKLLALGDTHTGYTHDSISHAFAVIDRLGRESGLWDTYIRTDSQWITKHPLPATARNGHTLDDFDAVFLFISGDDFWTAQQKADFLSFVRDDGKGVVAAHSGIAAFYHWPDYGEMIGGSFDDHPWNVFNGRVVVNAPDFPAMKPLPPSFMANEEFYVMRDKPYSRDKVRVLAHLDTTNVDLNNPDYHRKDADIPVAFARTYGKGRTFWLTFGHTPEIWDNPQIQQMYLEAIKWAMGLEPGDATPRPGPAPAKPAK